MKLATLSCLLGALASATYVLADTIEADAFGAELVNELGEPLADLEARQVPGQVPAATQGPHQVPSITVYDIESEINGVETWVNVPYTQTFAAVPDQLASPIPGTIGYGTLKADGKTKREAQAEPTGPSPSNSASDDIVLLLHTVGVTQWVHPVEEVIVYQVMAPPPVPLPLPSTLSNLTNGIPNITNVVPNITNVIPNITNVVSNITSVFPNITNTTLANLTFANVTFPWSPANLTNSTAYGNGTNGTYANRSGLEPVPYRQPRPQSLAYSLPQL